MNETSRYMNDNQSTARFSIVITHRRLVSYTTREVRDVEQIIADTECEIARGDAYDLPGGGYKFVGRAPHHVVTLIAAMAQGHPIGPLIAAARRVGD